MKQTIYLSVLLLAFLTFWSCEEDKDEKQKDFPSKFSIDIPDAVSKEATNMKSSSEGEPIQGNDLYEHMRNFIKLGENSAELIEEIMKSLATNGVNKAMEFSFTGEDDQRTKTVIVSEDKVYNGKTYALFLEMKDDDGSIAMQIIWNSSPIEGIAILLPYNMDRTADISMKNLVYKVEYSDQSTDNYDAQMTVSIAGWDMKNEIFGVDNLKMFVGKKGDIVEVRGNSNHPNAYLINPEQKGYSWAFVARGDDSKNIGVANLALPLNTVNTTDNIFTDHAVKKVLTDELIWMVQQDYPDWSSEAISTYINQNGLLDEAKSPAYFNQSGWISAGDDIPAGFSSEFIDLNGLVPFIPNEIKQLTIPLIE